jgi:tRNA pseudouridine55 synthase
MKDKKNVLNGILPVDKPSGKTSFSLVAALRRVSGVQKIGHTGTLDPFAQGVMLLLIGRPFTRLSDRFMRQDKEYIARIVLGAATDTYDKEGKIVFQSDKVPTLDEIILALQQFQGTILQTPPMFSAKKIKGKKLYQLARKGITIERKSTPVTLSSRLIQYDYPHLDLKITCSKGTYIRCVAHDLGTILGCGAMLLELTRTRLGFFCLKDCLNGSLLHDFNLIERHLHHDHP